MKWVFTLAILVIAYVPTMGISEITLKGKPVISNVAPGASVSFPLGNCFDRTDEILSTKLINRVNTLLQQEWGFALSDVSPYPNELLVEECKNTFIISTLLSENTFGHYYRIFIPKSDFQKYLNSGVKFSYKIFQF